MSLARKIAKMFGAGGVIAAENLPVVVTCTSSLLSRCRRTRTRRRPQSLLVGPDRSTPMSVMVSFPLLETLRQQAAARPTRTCNRRWW